MLIVVRHGQTAWNASGRSQGWAPIGLDEKGREQAAACAVALRDLVPPPVRLVSSDLPRAFETASYIGQALDVSYSVTPALREVDVGAWQGLTDTEVRLAHPDAYRRWKSGEDVRRGGAETYAEAGARVAGYIKTLVSVTEPSVSIIVVGHGKSLQWGLDQLAHQGLIDLEGGAPHLGNAEYLSVPDWRHDPDQRLLSGR
jgi:broad specificity phosphatase PhoE